MPFDASTLLDASHLVTFMIGTGVGAAGTYFADRFTDQRRKQEKLVEEETKFQKVYQTMPTLLDEMRADLQQHRAAAIREFLILRSEVTNYFGDNQTRLVYYESNHPHARSQVELLVAQGFVRVVRQGDATKLTFYRIEESLAERLLQKA
jgi:hypothetical protein